MPNALQICPKAKIDIVVGLCLDWGCGLGLAGVACSVGPILKEKVWVVLESGWESVYHVR